MSYEKAVNFLKTFKKLYKRQSEEFPLDMLIKMCEDENFESPDTCQCGKLKKVNYTWSFEDYDLHTCDPPDVIKLQKRLLQKSTAQLKKRLLFK